MTAVWLLFTVLVEKRFIMISTVLWSTEKDRFRLLADYFVFILQLCVCCVVLSAVRSRGQNPQNSFQHSAEAAEVILGQFSQVSFSYCCFSLKFHQCVCCHRTGVTLYFVTCQILWPDWEYYLLGNSICASAGKAVWWGCNARQWLECQRTGVVCHVDRRIHPSDNE